MEEGEQTFMRITNKDIYDKLVSIEKHVIVTNGKVKINSAMNKINLSLIITIIGVLIGVRFL